MKKEMKGFIRLIVLMGLLFLCSMLLSGCTTQADRVSENLAQEADNFNVVRTVTVINCITDDVILQVTGRISIKADTADKQLEIIAEVGEDKYQKHIIGLSEHTTYTVSDTDLGTEVSKYHFTINYNPKMWLPYEFENID